MQREVVGLQAELAAACKDKAELALECDNLRTAVRIFYLTVQPSVQPWGITILISSLNSTPLLMRAYFAFHSGAAAQR